MKKLILFLSTMLIFSVMLLHPVTTEAKVCTCGNRYCAYAARKDIHKYAHTHQEIMDKYGKNIVMAERMPDVLSGAMGNEMYTAVVASEEDVLEFAAFVQKRAE